MICVRHAGGGGQSENTQRGSSSTGTLDLCHQYTRVLINPAIGVTEEREWTVH